MTNAIWGNENPSSPYNDHPEECKCINCEEHRCACGNEVEEGEEFCKECK